MKNFIAVIICLCSFSFLNAQLSATTSNGRKVILNVSDYTWKYADNNSPGSQSQMDCEKQHLGNITVVNHSPSDIYFYYYRPLQQVYMVRVRANSSKTINDICSSDYCGEHIWSALFEQLEDPNTIGSAKGAVANGKFYVQKCGTKEIEIND